MKISAGDGLGSVVILTGSGGCGLVKLDPCRSLSYTTFSIVAIETDNSANISELY